jgi:hypothetical protein
VAVRKNSLRTCPTRRPNAYSVATRGQPNSLHPLEHISERTGGKRTPTLLTPRRAPDAYCQHRQAAGAASTVAASLTRSASASASQATPDMSLHHEPAQCDSRRHPLELSWKSSARIQRPGDTETRKEEPFLGDVIVARRRAKEGGRGVPGTAAHHALCAIAAVIR